LVVEGLKGLKDAPLTKYLVKKPDNQDNWKFQPSPDYRDMVPKK